MANDKNIFVGEGLRRLRKSIGKTQDKLAHDSKLDRSYVGRLENDKADPSLFTIFKLAKGLEMEPHEVVKEIQKDIDFDKIFEEEPDREP